MFGKLLFTTQIITMAFCFLPLKLILPSPLTLLFLMTAITIGLWVILHNKRGNRPALPKPIHGVEFITQGPYHFMRHPIYLSIMLGCLSAVLHNQSLKDFFAWIVLVLLLNIKARYEERLLKIRFPEYQQYQDSVKTRFFPSVF